MESPVQDVTVDETVRPPSRPLSAVRAEAARGRHVPRQSVMDWSKTPDSMIPENLYAAVSFDAVNRVFRDGKVFNSHIYD